MAKNNNVWIIIGLVIVGVLVYQSGGLGDLFGASNDQQQPDDLYPADLKTTVTLNTGDELATSATDANVSYYVFSPSGKFLKDGTTSAGTASFTVPTGVSGYQLLAYDDTSSTAEIDYLPIQLTFSTDGENPEERADKTINVDLIRESNTTVEAAQDPVDLNSVVATGAGQTVNFDVLISAELSNAAVYKPVLYLIGNSSCVADINFPALTEVTCPDRLNWNDYAENGNDWCFEYGSMLKSSDGILTLNGYFEVDASTDCPASGDGDAINITVIDTGIYREANYKTIGISAFKYGTENPIDNSNIGSGDIASAGWKEITTAG